MIEAAYDRIVAAIRHGNGARLIAVLVPAEIPLIPATEKLRSHLLGRGVKVRSIRIDRHASLVEAIEAADPEPSEAVIVYGLEALPEATRESFLRSSSFARSRLQSVPVAVILVLGTETWSWLGMELPDLARWADGPFIVSDRGQGVDLRPPRPTLGRETLAQSAVILDDDRNVDIQGPVDEWLLRGGILSIGGPSGAGVTHLAVRIEARLVALGKRPACAGNVHYVNGMPRVGGPENVNDPEVPWPKQWGMSTKLEDWLEQHKEEIVFIARPFWHPARASMMARKGITGVVLGPSSSALAQPHVGVQLYVPPVQVVESDGTECARGIARMVDAIVADANQLQFDLKTLVPRELLFTLAYASGGLPGLLWSLIIQTLRRSLRIGLTVANQRLVETIILDVAHSRPPVPEEAITSVVRENMIDFEMEARGAVLFYIIDGTVRTLQHPLSILAKRLRSTSRSTKAKPPRASLRRRRPQRGD